MGKNNMKIVELTAVPSVRVDDWCEPQIIGEDIHAIGYQLRQDPEGGDIYGVVEIRLTMNAKKFFAACLRGVEMMAQSGQLASEIAPTIHH